MKTQDKVGHLRGVSKNSVAKTGRDKGQVGPASGKTERHVVPATGKRGKANPNPVDMGGIPPS